VSYEIRVLAVVCISAVPYFPPGMPLQFIFVTMNILTQDCKNVI
jgi:hypothetical protein